ncbi:hypothetical protein ACJJTC_007519 [Scirpophaga incertulas]
MRQHRPVRWFPPLDPAIVELAATFRAGLTAIRDGTCDRHHRQQYLGGQRFETDEEVQEAVTKFLHGLAADLFEAGFQKWISRQQKCVDNSGDYVEKYIGHRTKLIIKKYYYALLNLKPNAHNLYYIFVFPSSNTLTRVEPTLNPPLAATKAFVRPPSGYPVHVRYIRAVYTYGMCGVCGTRSGDHVGRGSRRPPAATATPDITRALRTNDGPQRNAQRLWCSL